MQAARDASEREAPVDILLVDDRADNLTALVGMLERPGYRLLTASSGPEALKLLLRRTVALILLDIVMPTMDGFECASLIKGRERSRDVPIIFLTGAGIEPERLRQAYALGAVDYLTKPLVPEVVRAKVAFFVELHRKTEQTRRQAEALREAEGRERERQLLELQARADRRYRDLAEAIPQIVYRAAPNGAVTYLTRRWLEYTGFEPEAAEGWAFLEAIHPDDRQALRDAWAEATRTGERFQVECRLGRAEGGTFEWHLCQAVPELSASGTLVGWLGAYTDIHVQKQAEEERSRLLAIAQEARANAERNQRRVALLARVSAVLGASLELEAPLQMAADHLVRSFADVCSIAVAVESSKVQVTAYRNPAIASSLGDDWQKKVHTASRGAWVGRLGDLLLHPDDGALAPMSGFGSETVTVAPIEVRGRRLGSLMLLESRTVADGDLDLAFVVDLASRIGTFVENVHLYERSQEAVVARDDFLAVASHELRTPFTSLHLQAEMLGRYLNQETVSKDRAERAIGVMLRQVKRLAFMVDQLLDVSRIAAKRLILEVDEVDLRDIVDDVAERFQEELKGSQTTLRIAGGNPIVGLWDPSRVDQILSNLISNAVKYGKGGLVEITFETNEDKAMFTVADQGIGIAPGDIQRIFERFERAVPPGVYGGMGLGLYITRQLVLAHGGTIDIESEPGKGTRVRVALPRGSPPTAKRAIAAASAVESEIDSAEAELGEQSSATTGAV
jgi:PAS domain S-box-containing protein